MGIVLATLPATVKHRAPTIAWNSHVDTSPETTGANVRPQVIRNYPGGDIVLPANPEAVIRVSDDPELNELIGKTLITTDGTTLLGRGRQGRRGRHHANRGAPDRASRDPARSDSSLLHLR